MDQKATFLKIVDQIKTQGHAKFEPGLNDDEIAAVNNAIGVKLPPDLEMFLRIGIPNGFPDWRNPVEAKLKGESLFEDLFTFDIEQNDFWHPSFGARPKSVEDAKKKALESIRSLPPMIPMMGHRYMGSFPHAEGNPVVSCHGPSDTIYYGADLAEYLRNEYLEPPADGMRRPYSSLPEIPYWGPIFFDQYKSQ